MDQMIEPDPGPEIGSFAALGDSFTEGLNDPRPGGGFMGWADRVAAALAERAPGFRYANLAVRGKLLDQVIAEQVPRAIELAPDLVSLAAGGNDILRGADVDALGARSASAAATRSAQPMNPPPRYGSFRPSVKLSPSAAKEQIPGPGSGSVIPL